MDDVRKLIFLDMETVLEAIPGITYEGIGDILPDCKRMPQVALIPVSETTEPSATEPEFYHESLLVRVRTLVDKGHQSAGMELQDELAKIQRALMADKKRGGHADYMRKQGTDWLFLAPDNPQAGADLIFEIGYQSAARDPAQASVY